MNAAFPQYAHSMRTAGYYSSHLHRLHTYRPVSLSCRVQRPDSTGLQWHAVAFVSGRGIDETQLWHS